MKGKRNRPRWWLLYLSNIFVFGLLWLETSEPVPEATHVMVEAGLVLLLFVFNVIWLKFNAAALQSDVKHPQAVPDARLGDNIRRP